MDAIIEYDEAVGYLKKPFLEPCLDFNNIRSLKQHVIKALSQMFCPKSAIRRWTELAMDPARYLLLGGIVFVTINDPGLTAIYPQ